MLRGSRPKTLLSNAYKGDPMRPFAQTNERLSPSQLRDIALAAQSRMPVLVSGDTSARRHACARMIHDACVRERRPFVAVSCRARPPLSERAGDDEMRVEGRATRLQAWLERAKGGTLFMDELEHMSTGLQQQLLSDMEHWLEPDEEASCRVRIITGAKPGWAFLDDGSRFSERLYYRLNTIRIDCLPMPHPDPAAWGRETGPPLEMPLGPANPQAASFRRR